jgi:serine/threonine-protein kinase
MGIVYRAVQPMIGNSVAVKVLRPDVILDENDMQRFLGEARTVNSIRHRSIISIFGAGDTPDGRKYLVMEFLEGESLEARLAREGRLSSADAVPILEDVLSALAAAHAANVVHRDLKPANVFLVQQSDGRPWVKLLDFGLARRSSQDVSRIAGTPDYISPEHARGKPAGPPSDLYAFGVMAFHLLTGRLPFLGNTPMEVMEQHVHKPPPVPAEVDSTIPPALSELIIRLLAKDPAQRPNGTTVKADLKAAVKQLRAAQTQIGHVPGMGGMGMTGTVVREAATRPATAEAQAVRVDPRLEQLAIEADQSSATPVMAVTTGPGGGGLARNWPWLAGGLALAWLLAVAVYVLLTPTPTPRTDALPIPPPSPQAPAPPPEPDNAPPDVTGDPAAPAPGVVKPEPVKADPPKGDASKADAPRADPPPNKPKKHGK